MVPDVDGEVRVSSLQTGVFAGPTRSMVGQHRFNTDFLVGQRPRIVFTVEHATRRVRILGVTAPTIAVADQEADPAPGILQVHHDVAGLLGQPLPTTPASATFDAVFTAAGADVIRIPVRSPRANAIGERFVGSIRPELLDRILVVKARHAMAVLREYEDHFNHHRPTPRPRPGSTASTAPTRARGPERRGHPA